MSESIAGPAPAAAKRPLVAETELRAGALRLPEVVMQSITHIAPAIAILFSFQFIVGLAGVAAPWVYVAAIAIVLITAVSMTQLARAFPSAGGYYTYVSRSVHPRAGFLASWAYVMYTPPAAGVILAFMGWILQTELRSAWGWSFPWYVWMLIGTAIVTFVIYRGIEISGKALMIFGIAEISLVVLLSVWGLFETGKGGFSFAPFNPADLTSFNGFYLAVIFSIFAYTGWEGAAPLAEESENPHANVPKAVYGSIAILGALFLLTFWGMLVGWGVDDVKSLTSSSELPPFVLAHRFWHGAWVLILLALVNSTLAVSIAVANVSTRMWFAMGRTGSLPRAFAKVHPKYKTPVNALHLQTAFTLVVGLAVAEYLRPGVIWFFFGFLTTFAVVFVYSLANIGSFLLHRRERRSEFNPIMHVLFPLLSTAALIWLVYKTLNPYPPEPFKWAFWVVLGWILFGGAILYVMKRRGREGWLLKAGEAIEERPETDQELAHRPAI
jgi:amino acid transporter